jgi:hypothetical protein
LLLLLSSKSSSLLLLSLSISIIMASKLFRRCMTIQHLNNPLPHDVCGMVIGKWKKPKWSKIASVVY